MCRANFVEWRTYLDRKYKFEEVGINGPSYEWPRPSCIRFESRNLFILCSLYMCSRIAIKICKSRSFQSHLIRNEGIFGLCPKLREGCVPGEKPENCYNDVTMCVTDIIIYIRRRVPIFMYNNNIFPHSYIYHHSHRSPPQLKTGLWNGSPWAFGSFVSSQSLQQTNEQHRPANRLLGGEQSSPSVSIVAPEIRDNMLRYLKVGINLDLLMLAEELKIRSFHSRL